MLSDIGGTGETANSANERRQAKTNVQRDPPGNRDRSHTRPTFISVWPSIGGKSCHVMRKGDLGVLIAKNRQEVNQSEDIAFSAFNKQVYGLLVEKRLQLRLQTLGYRTGFLWAERRNSPTATRLS